MKAIFKNSLFDKKNIYWIDIESEESVVFVQRKVFSINERILKKGAKFTHIEPVLRYTHEGKSNG